MIAKLREELIKFFEDPNDEKESSISLMPIFIWAILSAIIGGLTPFVFPSNFGLPLSLIVYFLFLILTAKPMFKWMNTKDRLNNKSK